MEDSKSYYAIIPANVRYDNELPPNAKLLYGEITALTNEKGLCWASNDYFAKLYNVSKTSVSKWISILVEKGYIFNKIIYKEGSKEILNRYLSLVKYPIEEKLKENNTYMNNTDEYKESISKDIPKKVFRKPTIEEIKSYCKERNNYVDAETFYDFYESKDWYVGKSKMKDWKACVRTWEKNKPRRERKSNEFLETMEEFYNGTIRID